MKKLINSKKQSGKDLIVYGIGTFVTALINARLIDEFHLFINPTAIGRGMTIFQNSNKNLKLKLKTAKQLGCGITLAYNELNK